MLNSVRAALPPRVVSVGLLVAAAIAVATGVVIDHVDSDAVQMRVTIDSIDSHLAVIQSQHAADEVSIAQERAAAEDLALAVQGLRDAIRNSPRRR